MLDNVVINTHILTSRIVDIYEEADEAHTNNLYTHCHKYDISPGWG